MDAARQAARRAEIAAWIQDLTALATQVAPGLLPALAAVDPDDQNDQLADLEGQIADAAERAAETSDPNGPAALRQRLESWIERLTRLELHALLRDATLLRDALLDEPITGSPLREDVPDALDALAERADRAIARLTAEADDALARARAATDRARRALDAAERQAAEHRGAESVATAIASVGRAVDRAIHAAAEAEAAHHSGRLRPVIDHARSAEGAARVAETAHEAIPVAIAAEQARLGAVRVALAQQAGEARRVTQAAVARATRAAELTLERVERIAEQAGARADRLLAELGPARAHPEVAARAGAVDAQHRALDALVTRARILALEVPFYPEADSAQAALAALRGVQEEVQASLTALETAIHQLQRATARAASDEAAQAIAEIAAPLAPLVAQIEAGRAQILRWQEEIAPADRDALTPHASPALRAADAALGAWEALQSAPSLEAADDLAAAALSSCTVAREALGESLDLLEGLTRRLSLEREVADRALRTQAVARWTAATERIRAARHALASDHAALAAEADAVGQDPPTAPVELRSGSVDAPNGPLPADPEAAHAAAEEQWAWAEAFARDVATRRAAIATERAAVARRAAEQDATRRTLTHALDALAEVLAHATLDPTEPTRREAQDGWSAARALVDAPVPPPDATAVWTAARDRVLAWTARLAHAERVRALAIDSAARQVDATLAQLTSQRARLPGPHTHWVGLTAVAAAETERAALVNSGNTLLGEFQATRSALAQHPDPAAVASRIAAQAAAWFARADRWRVVDAEAQRVAAEADRARAGTSPDSADLDDAEAQAAFAAATTLDEVRAIAARRAARGGGDRLRRLRRGADEPAASTPVASEGITDRLRRLRGDRGDGNTAPPTPPADLPADQRLREIRRLATVDRGASLQRRLDRHASVAPASDPSDPTAIGPSDPPEPDDARESLPTGSDRVTTPPPERRR